MYICIYIGLAKNFIWVFHKLLWKKPNELFGQPNIYVYMCVCVYIYIYIHTHILFHILFHFCISQDIEYGSLCYTVGPCCLLPELFDHATGGASSGGNWEDCEH